MRFSGRRALLLLAALPALALAKGPDDYELFQTLKSDSDFEQKPWVEVQQQLPPPPDSSSLVPIDVSTLTSNKFAIDERSVTFGGDEVIRYTLVVTSPGGAQNISYEGIRCATGERRLYAFGRADGTWSKARNNAWVRITENNLNRHHAALFRDYFCTTGGSVSDTAGARAVLAHGNPAAKNQ
ncbi:MAG: CNP1-like family protein [Rhodocyclaceae bacterium]